MRFWCTNTRSTNTVLYLKVLRTRNPKGSEHLCAVNPQLIHFSQPFVPPSPFLIVKERRFRYLCFSARSFLLAGKCKNAIKLQSSEMKFLLTTFLVFSAAVILAQSNYDQRLLAKFDQKRIAELQSTQPQILAYWTYFLDHGYTVVDLANSREKYIPETKILRIKDLNNINILELDILPDRHLSKAYQIKGSNKLLVLWSNDAFVKKYERGASEKAHR